MIAPIIFAACLAVGPGSSQILARDLAPAWEALHSLPPDTPIAPAPMPGTARVFRPLELRQLAARWHLGQVPLYQLCMARPVKMLDRQRLLGAMRRARPAAVIEILDFSREPAPDGPIEFPRSGLRREAGAALWTGWVAYAGDRRFHVWARVLITESVQRVVAAADLPPGRPVAASQVSAVTRQEFPTAEPYAPSVADVVGMWPLRPIAAGTALRTDQLTKPKVVAVGDKVELEVRNGGAFVRLETAALGAGSVGEIIAVRNPSSRQLLRVRVVAPGKATVDPPLNPVPNPPREQEPQP